MRKKSGRIIIYLFMGILSTEMLQSCGAIKKKCGCGTDLMANYKPSKYRKR